MLLYICNIFHNVKFILLTFGGVLVNKRLFKYIMFIMSIVIMLVYMLLRLPENIEKNHHGVRYTIGDVKQVEDIELQVKGVIEKDWRLNKTFVGSIVISDINDLFNKEYSEEIKDGLLNSKIEIPLDENRWDFLSLYEEIENKGYRQDIGLMYFSDNFHKMAITINGPIALMFQNDLEGRIIAVPASNREEAVEVTNNVIQGFTLENLKAKIPQKLISIINDNPESKKYWVMDTI